MRRVRWSDWVPNRRETFTRSSDNGARFHGMQQNNQPSWRGGVWIDENPTSRRQHGWDGGPRSGSQDRAERIAAKKFNGPLSFAEVAKAAGVSQPLFEDIPIPRKRLQFRNGAPLILFADSEVAPAYRSMSHAIILKFAEGRPKVEVVREHIRQNWSLSNAPIVGPLDGRHMLIICSSEADAVEVLTRDSQRM
uniref:DUF4283 domain-containing protein n=1 Tax=Kalanchoe fedtschenkoi TaxID=63787 RepID=A0A7N0UEP9_KALFE